MKHDKTLNAAAAANKEAMPDDEVLEPIWADIDALLDAEPDDDDFLSNDEIFDLMIDRQTEKEETVPTEPCAEAVELLDQWSLDVPDVDWKALWQEAVDRRQAAETPSADEETTPADEPAGAPVVVNQATLIGTPCPEFEALMGQEATFLTGKQWDKESKKKSTQAGGWKTAKLTWQQQIFGFDRSSNTPEYGLSRHPVGKSKDGHAFVFGSSIGGQRKAAAMDTMYAIGLDIDSGASYDSVRDKIIEMGVAATMYTSWNHQKQGLALTRDDVLKKLGLTNKDLPDNNLSVEQVQTYLREFNKNRFEEDFLRQITIAEQAKLTGDSIKIILDTPPIEKFRVVFPLGKAVSLPDLALSEGTQRAALALWEDKITGLAQKHLDVHFDTSCTDPSRLFYTARHAEGKDNWRCDIIQGKPILFGDIQSMRKSEYVKNRVSGDSDNAFAEAGRGQEDTPGSRFKHYAATHGNRLRISEMLRDLCPDRVVEEKGDLSVVECPHKEGHSDDRDGSGYVRDADGMGRGFGWGCQRDSCKGRDRLDFLAKAVDEGWFDEEALYDEAYLWDGDEEEDEDDEVVEGEATSGDSDPQKPIPCEEWLPKGYKARVVCIYRIQKDAEDIPICQPFDVVGRASDITGTEGAGRIISFENENGVHVEMTLDRAELSKTNGGETIERLSDAGMLFFGHGTAWRNEMLGLLNRITVDRRVIVAPRPGFQRDRTGKVLGFLCPTGEYIDAGQGGPLTRLDSRAQVQDTGLMGTLDGWKDAADAALWRVDPDDPDNTTGNFHWTLCLAAGFGGVLLGLLRGEPVGFNLSGTTSRGKTVALRTAASIWANPDFAKGTCFTMNTTVNAIEDLASIGSETVLALDDLASMSRPQELSPMLFGLSSGAGKSRKAGRGAGLTKGADFRPFVLLSNERGLRSTIKGAGNGDYRAGVSVRFPDVDVTGAKKRTHVEMDRINKTDQNFGHAGPAFVRHLIETGLVQDADKVQRRVSAAQDRIAGHGSAGGDASSPAVRRAAKVFAIAQVAGELAVEAGLLRDSGPIRDSVKEAFRLFRESDEGRATEGEASMIESFKSWLVLNLGKAVIDVGDDRGYGDIVGWHTPEMIVLDWSAISDVEKIGVSDTRSALVRALVEIGAVQKSGRNSYHNKLPADVGGGEVRNLRIDREKLGV